MKRTPIQEHSSGIIKSLIENVDSLKNLDQDMVKGTLREYFVEDVIEQFLTKQFGVGKDVIYNQKGEHSGQLDTIIYDNRILPPFIEKKGVGVYPAEHVLAIIETRSWLSKSVIKEYDAKAKTIFEKIYNPDSSLYRDLQIMKPLFSVVGFFDEGIFKNESKEEIIVWMRENASHLFGICLIDNFSWLNVMRPEGSLKMVDENNEETKAFIAVLLDNVRTLSQTRFLSIIGGRHIDWLSIYTRDQSGIRKFFDQ